MPKDPDQIFRETRSQFPKGCRVKLSAYGRQWSMPAHHERHGTVKGYTFGGNATEGVSCLCCLKVLWDENKSPSVAHRSYYERVPEGEM